MKTNLTLAIIVSAFILTGCGESSDEAASGKGNAEQPATAVVAAAATATPPANWNAIDACAAVDKAAMAAIVGQAVNETTLGFVNASDGTTAAGSECKYTLADGSHATLMMRWSPIADNTDGAISAAKKGLEETLKAFGKTIEVIDGVGKAAFWTDATSSLNVFIGEDKFIIFNAPSGSEGKNQAIALARKLGA